uniref:Uncharacterized protein n=1 Tax=Arundo donax TaxID=35708 RepID=A0A0A9GMB1_ARUDO
MPQPSTHKTRIYTRRMHDRELAYILHHRLQQHLRRPHARE